MLRISNIKLPFDHTDSAIGRAITQHLGIADVDLVSYSLVRKSTDARKRDLVFFLYQVDVEVSDESGLLELPNVSATPDTDYVFTSPRVEREEDVPELSKNRLQLGMSTPHRPVIIGLGP